MVVNDDVEFVWSDHFKSGHPGIDAAHRQFVALVDAVAQVTQTDVDTLLERLERHCGEHFEQERELMIRHDFPAAHWFEGHLAYLDSALAQWVVRRTHGGVPVIVRRNITGAAPPVDKSSGVCASNRD